ncbi:hypothetical protein [Marisediminicola senii]|uniref:hypothetical protein n=1 Tax=Marisediminicola senii TaxID=2711233 RepID=UPI001F24BA4F|nr:hypothetical protein [Marisediminicola senii]
MSQLGHTPPQVEKGIERLLSVQRPLVLSHVRSIRRHHPDASPARVIQILERRYLTAVTGGGAAVGASAVLPGVGVGVSLALSGVETAGFLEASALFAQSVTEVHGIAVTDPERARTLVMAMMLGTAGSDLVRQLAGQVTGKGQSRSGFWGELVTKSLPQAAMGNIADRLKRDFVRRFATSQSATVLGRAIPFGIGAVVGGTGNNILGRRVIKSSRDAFGPAPDWFPIDLEPRATPDKPRLPLVALRRRIKFRGDKDLPPVDSDASDVFADDIDGLDGLEDIDGLDASDLPERNR